MKCTWSYILLLLLLLLSRHTVVCRAAKKAGDHTVSIFTGRKKTAFSCVHTSMAPSPKHTILHIAVSQVGYATQKISLNS